MEKPALSLMAMPGKRRRTIEVATEADRRGFAGLYCPTMGDGMALCQSIATATEKLRFGTSIANIYARHPADYAQTASYIHEISGGRFYFGIGVSHDAFNEPMGLKTGKPLTDIRNFVAIYKKAEKRVGPVAPLVLATLRKKMAALSAEIGDGAVWANASLSHASTSLQALPADKRDGDFFIGNMIPTCISDDREAAAGVMRKVLRMYVQLPNYQKYWEEAGYEQEMADIRAAVSNGQLDRLDTLMHEEWLSDVTLYGSASRVLEGIEKWQAAGVKTPIITPSSVNGGQLKAIDEFFALFD